jgi:hypothetical protein
LLDLLFMIKKLLFIFLFFPCIYSAQTDSVEKAYYRDGRLRFIATWKKGNDTLLFWGYYKSGQLKDSTRLYWTGRREFPVGTEKTYYRNGQLKSIIYHKNIFGEHTAYQYHKNGRLKRFVQKPTGLAKSYNKKGEQVSEADFHESREVFVSRRFRKGRHLKSNYAARIKTKKAWLADANTRQRLSTGVLVSVNLVSDTLLRSHCQIEGFSNDSIYFSKFHYNESYEWGSGLPMLQFDSSFAVGFNQLKTIYYSKHKNRKRTLGAMSAYLAGIDLVFYPVIPFAIVSFGQANPAEMLAIYSAFFAAPGISFYFLSQHLYKTTVPKKYDMGRYKIQLKV